MWQHSGRHLSRTDARAAHMPPVASSAMASTLSLPPQCHGVALSAAAAAVYTGCTPHWALQWLRTASARTTPTTTYLLGRARHRDTQERMDKCHANIKHMAQPHLPGRLARGLVKPQSKILVFGAGGVAQPVLSYHLDTRKSDLSTWSKAYDALCV